MCCHLLLLLSVSQFSASVGINSSDARLTKRKKAITRLYWNHSAAKRDVQSAGYLAQLHIPCWGRDDFDCEAQKGLQPPGALHKAARAFLD
jgi:hypothetical protein